MKERSANLWVKLLAIALIVAVLNPVPASAEEANKKRGGANANARIKKLEKAVEALQAELAALKAERTRPASKERIDAMVSRAIREKKADISSVPEWVTRTKLSGDFRYRHEWIDDESKADDRNRNRIRMRLMLASEINDEVDVGIRIASGESDTATSTNQSLTGAWTSKDLWLDLAYFDYHPESYAGVNIIAGKIKNPFFRAGKSDIMFDNDVNPEGGVIKYKRSIAEGVEGFANAGAFYITEGQTSSDSSLFAGQVGLSADVPGMADTSITGGVGFFNFAQTKNETPFVAGKGNLVNGSGKYVDDFNVLEFFGELSLPPVDGMPLTVFGHYIDNRGATRGGTTGYYVGTALGKCKAKGSWQAKWSYRDVGAEATIGAFSDADFGGGGTAVKGHKFSVGYQLAKNWQFVTDYYMSRTTDGGETDYDKLHVNMVFKF